jgi:hypothetical protein
MSTDKKTIGISSANAQGLAELVSRGRFATELDAAKFAMAHAISAGVPAGSAEATDTKWNVGSIDPDGSLRSVLGALYPDAAEPYRLAEFLMNRGIDLLTGNEGTAKDPYTVLFSSPSG